MFLQEALLASAKAELENIAQHTRKKQMLCMVGVPLKRGCSLYNCAAVLFDGRILGVVPKKNIPNYSEFYEMRYFTPAPQQAGVIEINGEEIPSGKACYSAVNSCLRSK